MWLIGCVLFLFLVLCVDGPPLGDIDMCAFMSADQEKEWFVLLNNALCRASVGSLPSEGDDAASAAATGTAAGAAAAKAAGASFFSC